MQIFPKSTEQQASLIDGFFAPERAFVQFWELEQGVLASQDLSKAQTVGEGLNAEVVKKEKWLHPCYTQRRRDNFPGTQFFFGKIPIF